MIRVTTEDLSGKQETQVVEFDDDYVITCAGRCYLAHTQVFANGTHILTVKKDRPGDGEADRQ